MFPLALVVAAHLFCLGAIPDSTDPTPIPVFDLHSESFRPTKERIRDFLNRDMEWGGDLNGYYEFSANGTASYQTEAGERTQTMCQCLEPAPYSTTSDQVSFRSRYLCRTKLSETNDSETTSPRLFVLKIIYVSKNALLFKDQDGIMVAVPHCNQALKHCMATAPGRTFDYLSKEVFESINIQLIPGSHDGSTLRAIEERLQLAATQDRNAAFFAPPRPSMSQTNVVITIAPPARVPRHRSEIFYVVGQPDNKTELALDAANAVAGQLEPLIGKVSPKKWPGAWPAQVVVVTGEDNSTSLDAGSTGRPNNPNE